MKRLSVFCAVILAAAWGTISCSKSSDPAPPLLGTWTIVNYSVTGCTDTASNLGLTDCDTPSGVSITVFCETWVITATTISVTSSLLTTPLVVDYKLNGNTLTTSISGVTLSTATYSKTDSKLKLSFPAGASNPGCTVVENFNKV